MAEPAINEFCAKCYDKLSLLVEPKPRKFSFDEKLSKVEKYLPKGPTEKILFQRNRIKGDCKQVPVMLCDLAGFTSLSEKIDPGRANAFIDQVFEILNHKVYDYEGTVNEMIGGM